MEDIQEQIKSEVTLNESTPERIRNGWTTMPRAKRIALIVGVSAAIVGAGYYTVNSGNSNYVVLYDNLDYKAAGEIKQALVELGTTNYKISSDGSSILVKSSDVNSLRMDLAVNGYSPNAGTGYELFDSAQLGMTEQERQIMYQRALEGELRRSIISLDTVEDARVHLNLTEESVFVRDQQVSSASIILNLARNATMTEAQVKGIIALVSGAVQNLDTSNIEIIDSNGNLLSAGQGTELSGSDRIGQETTYESHLEEKVRSQLGKVLGYDQVAVSVRVSLNQTSEEQRKEEYSEGTVLSEQTQFNRIEGDAESDTQGGGPVDNNMQNEIVENTENAVNNPDILDYSNTTNHQPSLTETHTVKPPGEIDKISVSIIYNGELTQPLAEELERQVASMVGIDSERGDSISVAGIPFNLPAFDENPVVDLEQNSAFNWLLYGTLGLSVAAFAGFLFSRGRKRKSAGLEMERELYTTPIPVGGLDIENKFQDEMGEYLNPALTTQEAIEQQLFEVANFFRQEKEAAIDLLRIWMNEEDSSGSELTGIEKTALLLVVLGMEVTSEVMKVSSQDEVIKLAHIMATTPTVPYQQSVELITEFVQMMDARQFIAQGGYDFAKNAMINALGAERTDQLLRKVKGAPRNKRPFEVIRTMDASQLYNALSEEHPQTIALVLCYLPTDKAAAIISELPESLQLEVTQRIGMMNNTSSQIVDEVENVIEARLQSLMSADMTTVGGLATVVDILNSVDRGTQKHIIDLLGQENARLAEEVRDSLFTFEDLTALDAATIQRIIREVDTKVLATSLKGASDVISKLITDNMSSNAAERLKEDIDYLGPVRLTEVEKAQHEIISIVRRLEDAGEIIISRGGSDDVVY